MEYDAAMHKPSTSFMSRKPGKASDLAGVMNGGNKSNCHR